MWRRSAVIVVVSVILGGLTTWCIGWVCALFPDPGWPEARGRGYLQWKADQSVWDVNVFAKGGAVQVYSDKMGHPSADGRIHDDDLTPYSQFPQSKRITLHDVPTWSRFHSTPTEEDLAAYCDVWREHGYGWPCLCLSYCQENDYQIRNSAGVQTNPQQRSRYTDVIMVKPFMASMKRWEFLPTGIIWFGFAINTALYSASWCMVLTGTRALRRFIRRKSGRCIRCGYDLRGQDSDHPICPECGLAPSTIDAPR